mgnify:CR=1 FL=1
MSKELLEEIKEHVKWTVENGLQPRVEDSDLEWLINRVEELEKDKNEYIRWWKDEARLGNELRDENQRYKQALEEIKNFTPVQDTDSVVEIKGIAEEALK